jgi:hypothetical protein
LSRIGCLLMTGPRPVAVANVNDDLMSDVEQRR